MPKYKSPESLQQLCLQMVGSNMDFWCKEFVDRFQIMKCCKYFIGPFDNISSVVCEMLLEHLMDRRNLIRPYLYLLINHGLVNLNFSRCHLRVKDDIINVVLTRCKNLKSINLRGCTQLKKETIVALAEAYPNLVSLDLSRTKCEKEAAKAVFKNCTKVKELYLSCCQLDDDDLSILIDSVKNKRTHKNLQRFDLSSTNASCNGLTLVVRNLPWVTMLKHKDLVECLSAEYYGRRTKWRGWTAELTTLNLTSLTIMRDSRLFHMVMPYFMMFPQLVKLEVVEIEYYDKHLFHEIGNLSMLQDLRISMRSYHFIDVKFGDLLQALKKIGQNLKRLTLNDVELLNPLIIAKVCPNLIELHLTCYNTNLVFHGELDKDCPSTEICFTKLKILTLAGNDFPKNPELQNSAQTGLTRFLCACRGVEKLMLVQLDELTDNVLNSMLKVNDMPCLTILKMFYCHYVTSNSFDKLIFSPTNNLGWVIIRNCQKISYHEYSNRLTTIKEKNSSLKLEWAGINLTYVEK